MLNIVTALKIEALPIIKKYNLKPAGEIYQNNYINLIITGQGKLKSAISTAILLQKYPFKSLNIGIAGSNLYNINEGFFIHKIIDTDSSLEYYPDFFQKSSTLYTVSQIKEYYPLTDMEGSGFFEACYKFLNVEEIILYKIVSDTPKNPICKEEIPNFINSHLEIIEELLDKKNNNFFEDINDYIKEAKQKMKLTKTQENQLKQILTYYKLTNKNFPTLKELKNKKEVREFLNSLTS
jgi:hypothetical protein